MLYALWAFGGWCGTPYPGWWKGPRPPQPPEPWFVKIASIIGGVAGGWMTQSIIGPEIGAMTVLATLGGAVVTGGFLGGLVGMFGGRSAAGG